MADVYSSFFKAPSYDVKTVEYAESTKSPLAIAELVSIDTFNFNASSFTGPVLVCHKAVDTAVYP